MSVEIIIEGFYDFADSRTSHQVCEKDHARLHARTTCGHYFLISDASEATKPKCKKCLKYLRHEK